MIGLLCVSHLIISDSLWVHGLYTSGFLCLWNSPSKNIGGVIIYLSRGSSQPRNQTPDLQHWRQILFTIWSTREARSYSINDNSTFIFIVFLSLNDFCYSSVCQFYFAEYNLLLILNWISNFKYSVCVYKFLENSFCFLFFFFLQIFLDIYVNGLFYM